MSIKTCVYELIRIELSCGGYERNHIFAGFSTIHVLGNGILQF